MLQHSAPFEEHVGQVEREDPTLVGAECTEAVGAVVESGANEDKLWYYRLLTEGQNWRNLPKKVQQGAMGDSFFAGGGKTGFCRRLAWDKPAPTLVTSPTMPATDLCHPEALRPLSKEESQPSRRFHAITFSRVHWPINIARSEMPFPVNLTTW